MYLYAICSIIRIQVTILIVSTESSHHTRNDRGIWENLFRYEICPSYSCSIIVLKLFQSFVLLIPGNLTFGIVAIVLLYLVYTFSKCDFLMEKVHDFFVSDGIESGSMRILSLEILYLLYESRLKHDFDSCIDRLIECLPLSMIGSVEKCRKIESERILYTIFRYSLRFEYFDRSYHGMMVMRMYMRGWEGIEWIEYVPEMIFPIFCHDFLQFFPSYHIWWFSYISPLEDNTIDIETGPTTENWDLATIPYLVEDRSYSVSVFYDRKCHIRGEDIEHIMGNSLHFLWSYFSGANIHPSIYLPRIDGYDLSGDTCRYIKSDLCLSTSSRSVYHYEGMDTLSEGVHYWLCEMHTTRNKLYLFNALTPLGNIITPRYIIFLSEDFL